jgi:nucleotide-binding universal stress UspA family protein
MAMTSEARLWDEYRAWTAEHGLPYVSADDLAHEPGLLTDEERRYIANFMASHRRSGLSAVVLGSVTNKVLTHTKTPVLVCH